MTNNFFFAFLATSIMLSASVRVKLIGFSVTTCFHC
jgi:hypothetical protein